MSPCSKELMLIRMICHISPKSGNMPRAVSNHCFCPFLQGAVERLPQTAAPCADVAVKQSVHLSCVLSSACVKTPE